MAAEVTPEVRARKKFVNNLLTMGVVLLLAVIVWLVVEAFFLDKKSTLPTSVTSSSRRINPVLESDVLTVIENKNSYNEEELSSFPIFIDDSENNMGGNREALGLIEKSPQRPGDELAINLEAQATAGAVLAPQEEREALMASCLTSSQAGTLTDYQSACSCVVSYFDRDYASLNLATATVAELETWMASIMPSCL